MRRRETRNRTQQKKKSSKLLLHKPFVHIYTTVHLATTEELFPPPKPLHMYVSEKTVFVRSGCILRYKNTIFVPSKNELREVF